MAILTKRHSSAATDNTKSSASAAAGETEASAVAVASLSDDMLAEIIRRLPVDSVARSKCVSKTWCATVSDAYLRRRLPLQLSVVYFPDSAASASTTLGKALQPRFACADSATAGGGGVGMLRDRDLGFFPFLDVSVVCDACNGLLLLRAAGTRRFYVVDPVTRRWAALPPPARDPRLSMLAFDPSSSSSSSGSGGFHVINFTGRWRDRGGEVEVYSSETSAWSLRDAEFGVPAASLSGSVHFHAGAVYVLAADPDCVVRMDVFAAADGDIACAVAELPEPADGGGGDGRLAHSAGRLHYVATDAALQRLKVWVLDGEAPALRWRMKHDVKLGDVVELAGGCGGGRGSEARFLALHPEKDAVYVWSAGKLLEYDLARKEVTGAWAFGKGGEKNRVVKTWLVPSSMYLSDCLPLLSS